MKTKVLRNESFASKHKYAALIFIFIFLYNLIFVNKCQLWTVDGYAYTFHLVDFSVGFHTCILPGAVFWGLLGKHASETVASIYVLVLMAFFMMLVSLGLEGIIKAIIEKQKLNVLLLVLFCVTGKYTVTNCFSWFGFFDMYLIFLSILFFVCIKNRFTLYLVPVIFVIAVMIHFSAFFTCIPLFGVVLLYKIVQEKEHQKKLGVILLVSVLAAGVLGLYILTHWSTNLNYSMDQFHDFLIERAGPGYNSQYNEYYDYLFYKKFQGIDFSGNGEESTGLLSGLVSYFINYIKFNNELMPLNDSFGVLSEYAEVVISIPFFAWYYWVIIRYIRKNRVRLCQTKMIIPLALSLLQLPVVAGSYLFSKDKARWPTHIVTALTAEMMFFISNDDQLLDEVDNFFETNRLWVMAYLYITATTTI